ncbi:hypothetical protein [Arthrobacter sp. UYEF3]|uniref:hypothetical protein n=1 Tax=Arthrobacter sp. UYEF3 TaxID=1756365 RepID=UPI003399BDCF
MALATLAVLAGAAAMVGALLSQAAGRDTEPYLAAGLVGLAGGCAVAAMGGSTANRLAVRVRLLRDWRTHPRLVRIRVLLAALGALTSATAMLMAAAGAPGRLI